MEDVLSLYQRPEDPWRPLVCLDEKPQSLHAEIQEPLPQEPGQPERYDYEYRREGTANLFLLFAPLSGWRRVKVTAQRTAQDFAAVVQELVDVHYPQAEQIVLVLDNLNTHKLGSLYETFPPAEARRLAAKLEIHYTPKHGSWLNMAEIELSVLERQCLRRRIPDPETLAQETAAWAGERNQRAVQMQWRFTTADARIKLRRLYPSLED
jgi:hypothetical protein